MKALSILFFLLILLTDVHETSYAKSQPDSALIYQQYVALDTAILANQSQKLSFQKWTIDSTMRDTLLLTTKQFFNAKNQVIEEIRYDKVGTPVLWLKYDYQDSLLLGMQEFDPTGEPKAVHEFVYGPNKKLNISYLYYYEGSHKKIISSKSYIYNKTGKLEGVHSFNQHNELIFTQTYKYDKKGLLTSTFLDTKLLTHKEGDIETRYIYNEHGNLKESSEWNIDYVQQNKTVYLFNDKQQVKEVHYYNEHQKLEKVEKFSFDENGKIHELKELDGDLQETKQVIFQYLHFN